MTQYSFDLLCIPLALLPVAYLMLVRYLSFRQSKKLPLPPSPPSWPVVGHLFSCGRKHHVRFAEFSHQYGPLISLKLGSVFMVVASTPEAASEILRTHDRILSGRVFPPFYTNKHIALKGGSIMHSLECDEKWKSLRNICQAQLFSATAIQSQVSLREQGAAEMVEYLRSMEGQVVNIPHVLSTTVLNGLSKLMMSKDLLSFDDVKGNYGMRQEIKRFLEVSTTPSIADFYPWTEALDVNGLGKQIAHGQKEFLQIWKGIMEKRRQSFKHDDQSNENDDDMKQHKDLLDCLLANHFDDDVIDSVFLELFLAGSDATITTVEWALTELIRNGEAMLKLKQELSQALSGMKNAFQVESLITDLPYLLACIKETFRLHPAVPLLVPHRAIEECKVMNYRIPKDSKLIVNIWAIGRDPSVWDDPLLFKPERFLDRNVDVKGQDLELLPFGSGRRICPGYPLALRQTALLLASLIAFFEWELPDGGDKTKLDVNEKFSVTLCKENSLLVVPKQTLP